MFEKDAEFIKIEGADLSAKLEFLIKQRATELEGPGRYWIAYTFPSRPDVALEAVRVNANGSQTKLGIITGPGHAHATLRAGLFLLYEGKSEVDLNRPSRVELFDLDQHQFRDRLPVYWLGPIEASQSLEFLDHLIAECSESESCVCSTEAAAVHDHPAVAELLKKWARRSSFAEGRMAAIRWLGRLAGHLDFLAAVVTDEVENTAVRQQAALSIGKSAESEAVAVLCKLYEVTKETPVKTYLITALSKQQKSTAALNLLRTISESEVDPELRLHSRAKLDKARRGTKQWKKGSKGLFRRFRKKTAL